jgi:sugar lactone lactonase YvrE
MGQNLLDALYTSVLQTGRIAGTWCSILAISSLPLFAQATPPRIEGLSPKFFRLVDKNAAIEQITGGSVLSITEGPLWNPNEGLIFSDIYQDKIYRWSEEKQIGVLLDTVQYPNGLAYDRTGRLLICDQKQRRIVRLGRDDTLTVVADRYEGKSLNCPNDLVVRKDGTIYFTDPWWSFPPNAQQELPFQAVFHLSPEGRLSVGASDFDLPNGIALSPDEKTLYVGDTRRAKLYALDIAPDGSLSGQRLLAELKSSSEKGAVDGMKTDELGNIWSTGPGGVWVLDKDGKHLGTIRLPPPALRTIATVPPKKNNFPNVPANLAWGGNDYRTLYLTAPGAVYRLRTRVRGKAAYSLK